MSLFKVSCPQCQQSIEVEPQFYGVQSPCPTCQTLLVIPHPEAPTNAASSPDMATSERQLPSSVKFLAWYYIIGAIPFILFSLFCFTIPPEKLTNHPEYIDRDRGFIIFLKVLMFGGFLVYAMVHVASGVGMLRFKKWGYITACILTGLGVMHLNPFTIPGAIICLRKNVREFFSV